MVSGHRRSRGHPDPDRSAGVRGGVLIERFSPGMRTVGFAPHAFGTTCAARRGRRRGAGGGLRADHAECGRRVSGNHARRQSDRNRWVGGRSDDFIISGGGVSPDRIHYSRRGERSGDARPLEETW